MRRKKNISGRKDEQGIVIVLVAVVMLFVVGAMAALSIDVVTLYTARSEAQLAADAAALAAARVLANSGTTSDFGLLAGAETRARNVARHVAEQNQVGGKLVAPGEITVSFGGTDNTNPTVTVSVKKNDLPTFFARIWGTKFVTVGATATAEAYNPSGPPRATATATPVAPICVKPWLLPNKDPSPGGNTIFNPSGNITNTNLLGFTNTMTLACPGANGACTTLPASTAAWSYFPGDDATTFPHPTNSLPTCNPALTTNYQESVAGCIQIPISCSSSALTPANIDTNPYPSSGRNPDTADAVNCLTHATNNDGDTVTSTAPPAAPFEFFAGADNPVAVVDPTLSGKPVMVSDSLVTVPVFDDTGYNPGWTSVPIIGFVQLFLNPAGTATLPGGSVSTTVINIAGCGTGATGTPILGNGASPVAVRLISPP